MKRFFSRTHAGAKAFLTQRVWSEDTHEAHWSKGLLYGFTRFAQHVAAGFVGDQCLLRASALTYTSLLSLVPFLALMFAILKGLGFQSRLEPILLEKFTPASQEVVTSILEYVDRTNVSSLGVVGVFGLLITALMTLKNMEGSFNWIWKVGKGRSWLRTVSDYMSVLVIAPFFILAALSLTTYFGSPSIVEKMESIWIVGGFYRFLIKLSPYVMMWIAFTVCYLLMPNTRVRIVSAILGGTVGGTLWQLAQWGYVHYQFGVAKYNAIYGALSQLPILLVWIYLSWVILLLGAEVTFAHQNLAQYTAQKALSLASAPPPVFLTLRLLGAVAERFRIGETPYSVEEVERLFRMDRSFLEQCLGRLEALGWIVSREGSESLIVFQRPPDQMPLRDILRWESGSEAEETGRLQSILERANEGAGDALGGMTVSDLVRAPKDSTRG
jgi:membrane protein